MAVVTVKPQDRPVLISLFKLAPKNDEGVPTIRISRTPLDKGMERQFNLPADHWIIVEDEQSVRPFKE